MAWTIAIHNGKTRQYISRDYVKNPLAEMLVDNMNKAELVNSEKQAQKFIEEHNLSDEFQPYFIMLSVVKTKKISKPKYIKIEKRPIFNL